MCPDPGILSAYKDGEVPAPWNGRIRSHLETCASCRARLEGFSRLSEALGGGQGEASLDAAKARVMARLSPAIERAPEKRKAFWRRYLVIPLPLAAAAALVVATVPALGVAARLLPGGGSAMAKADETARTAPSAALASEKSAFAQEASLAEAGQPGEGFSDFAALLDYLNSQEGYIRITVDIPPNRDILPGGPAEIRKVSMPAQEGR